MKKYHYYWIDQADNSSEDRVREYENEEAFFEGMAFNREVEVENGEEPHQMEDLRYIFSQDYDDIFEEINGAWFVKTTKSIDEIDELHL